MSTSSASGRRPVELDDPAWLRRRYERDGDKAIASELGVDPKTVTAARFRHGIPSLPPGRRRGVTTTPITNAEMSDRGRQVAEMLIVARIQSEARRGGYAPGSDLAASRIRAAHEAALAGDQMALEDAVEAAASAFGLWLKHLRRLRGADP